MKSNVHQGAMRLIAHSERVFSIAGFLVPQECLELIDLAEAQGYSAAEVRMASGSRPLPQIRNNERAQFASPEWTRLLWDRLATVTLPELDGEVAVGLPADLRFYRYRAGQRFKMHKDGAWHEDGLASKLTLLVYLNEGYSGGDTDFREFRVTPATGSALIFLHDTWHEGQAITAGVKHVLRSDILYRSIDQDDLPRPR